jgi:hypothetical protein
MRVLFCAMSNLRESVERRAILYETSASTFGPDTICTISIAPGLIADTMARPDAMAAAMALNTDKIDDTALALLYLTLHNGYRAWKGFDWNVLGRLHVKGMIDNPVGKTKSIAFTEEGLERAKALFEEMFEK